MFIVTASMIIAWELIVVMSAYIYHVIPLKNYSRTITRVQIILSSCSVMLGAFAYFYVKINYNSGMFDGSKWDEKGILIILFLLFLCFLMSILRFFFNRKASQNREETFIFKAGDYRIVKDLDLMMGDYFFMPNVKAYCEFEGGKIVFTGSVPEQDVDCNFTCRMVKDGIYECLSYEILNKDIKVRLAQIIQIVFFILIAVDFALAMIWLSQAPELNIDLIGRLTSFLSLSLFGIGGLKLFKGAKGIGAILMKITGYLIILAGIFSFIK
ncbi:hypothetical protein [Butyrivibrio hungatei]|uniref:hypothetical protein n=1 Tax=Butyrivibrio hungatei TaxID=185008 RepID=UPI00042213C5|nr:hypothetical protein [Butyrivibrio hungatei]